MCVVAWYVEYRKNKTDTFPLVFIVVVYTTIGLYFVSVCQLAITEALFEYSCLLMCPGIMLL